MSTPAGCFIVVLAAVLAVVWRRRQRWRRARPWLAKLRAEIEERESCSTPRPVTQDRTKDINIPISKPLSSDKERVDKAVAGKRTKERRKRGKEPKRTVAPAPPSPRLVPLPISPELTPKLVLAAPASPTSTLFTEMTATTPATSPAPSIPKSKLPAFPPASPLPPSLARKPPPMRRTTPSLTSINTAVNTAVKKDSESDRPKPVRKQSERSRKASGPTPESTQIASLKGALEAARLREEEVAEERKAWLKKERELQTQVNQLSHQLHALTIAFATGGGQGFPPYGYGYGTTMDPTMTKPESNEPQTAYPMYPYPLPPYPPYMPGAPIPQVHTPMTPQPPPIVSPPMSPPQPYHFSAPWQHRGPSPMLGMTSPGIIPMNSPMGVGMNPGRHHFYSGSPRRGGSRPRRPGTGTPSTPSVGSVDDAIPLPERKESDDWRESISIRDPNNVFASRDNVFARSDSSVRDEYVPPQDYIPLREDYIPIPPPSSGTKREREETDEDDDDSTSDSDDEDSVIFEDGSVGESINLSLRGDKVEQEVM